MMKTCTAFDCDHTGPPARADDPRYHCDDARCENWWRRCPVHNTGKNKVERMVK